MPKNLSTRVIERSKNGDLQRQSCRNRAAFLSLQSEIAQALSDGWPMKLIWETLKEEGEIQFGYDAFIRYVNQLIHHRSPKSIATSSPPAPEANINAIQSTTSNDSAAINQDNDQRLTNPSDSQRDFTFNPRPDRNKLI